MAKLTGSEITWTRPVLHDIFTAGGLVKNSVRTFGTNRVSRHGLDREAKIICDEIRNRVFDFISVDKAINQISRYVIFTPLHENGSKSLTPGQIARILAAACATQEIFWDDVNTSRTTVEMDTYRMSTFGKACWEFQCFLSQQADKKAKPMKVGGTVGSTRRSGGVGRTGGTSSYKSSGPKSGLIGGLIGEPGDKIHFTGTSYLYDIICESSKKKTQFVFIDPIAYKSDINKVRFGDPSGWSACKLLYETREEAEAAIQAIRDGGFRIPTDITGFTPAKQKVDPNGYFKVKTEVGPAYIKASKLNEAMEEALESSAQESVVDNKNARFPEIGDIDVYSEAMHRFE
jgi:hypothetical protein